MTINYIMLQEMMEAEKEQRREEARRDAAGIRSGRARVRVASVCFGVLAVALLVFLAWCIVSDAPHRFPAKQVKISR